MTSHAVLPAAGARAPRARAHADYPLAAESLPPDLEPQGAYRVRFARSRDDLDRVLRLRFEVFNLELGEGLDEAFATGRDDDGLDERFHHLLIEHVPSGAVAGTYRMQTREMAARHGGFYSAGEFDLGELPEALLARSIEVGRACVARAHRNGRVLHLLWQGLARYLAWNGKTVLFGCCSLASQDERVGVDVFHRLVREEHLDPDVRVRPLPATMCVAVAPSGRPHDAPEIPALFQSYLRLGARVWGPPAIDRAFRTIDFLVGLDTDEMDEHAHRSLFR